jgi:hypothetical protein
MLRSQKRKRKRNSDGVFFVFLYTMRNPGMEEHKMNVLIIQGNVMPPRVMYTRAMGMSPMCGANPDCSLLTALLQTIRAWNDSGSIF